MLVDLTEFKEKYIDGNVVPGSDPQLLILLAIAERLENIDGSLDNIYDVMRAITDKL